VSFFVSAAIAPAFGAAMTPDVPAADMPPQPLGWDGNFFSFVVAAPVVVVGWGLCERDALRHRRAGGEMWA
jgi:hypothetical protein